MTDNTGVTAALAVIAVVHSCAYHVVVMQALRRGFVSSSGLLMRALLPTRRWHKSSVINRTHSPSLVEMGMARSTTRGISRYYNRIDSVSVVNIIDVVIGKVSWKFKA